MNGLFGALLQRVEPYTGMLKIAAVMMIIAAVFSAGMKVQGWRKDAEIAQIKQGQSDQKATDATAAVNQLKDAAKIVNDAAQHSMVNVASLQKSIDNLQTAFKNAKPLPPDCRPDDFRLKHLEAAIDAVKKSLEGSAAP